MALFTPAQLDDLRELSAGLLGHIRQVLRGEDVPADRFGSMMRRLQSVYGLAGAAHAVRFWLDTVIEASPTFNRGEIQALFFANPTGTGYQDPSTLSSDNRWAAAVLLARISDDQVSLYRLIDQLPPYQAGLYLLRVLQMSAELLNTYENPKNDGRPVKVGEVIRVTIDAGAH
jgi:hypothetical protein